MEQTLNQSEAFFLKYKKAIITVVVAIIVIIVGAVLYKTYILLNSPTSTVQQLPVTCQTSTQVSAMPSWVSGTLP